MHLAILDNESVKGFGVELYLFLADLCLKVVGVSMH